MKLYLIGPVGSGKTTLARQLSKKTGVPCFHLDQVVHRPYPSSKLGNQRRTDRERDQIFQSILSRTDYILEDTGRPCFEDALDQVDWILLLEPPTRVRLWRILRRWVRQNLGVEACAYHPTWTMLGNMFRWTRDYNNGKDGVRARAERYPHKLVVLRSKKDLNRFWNSLSH